MYKNSVYNGLESLFSYSFYHNPGNANTPRYWGHTALSVRENRAGWRNLKEHEKVRRSLAWIGS